MNKKMAYTYTQIYVQIVFTVKGHKNLIPKQNREEHHKKTIFKEEYLDFLKKFEIEYNKKYLFEWLD